MTAVAGEWKRLEIPYGIVHGLEEFPRRYGRDIDVMASPRDYERLARAVESQSTEHGFRHARRRHPFGLSVYITRAWEWDRTIEIHLLPRLEWFGVVLAEAGGETRDTGPFQTDPWAGWVKTALQPLLVDDPRTRPVTPCPPEIAVPRIRRLLGAEWEKRFLDSPSCYTPKWLNGERPAIRRQLILRRFVRRPLGVMAGLGRWAGRKNGMRRNRLAIPLLVTVGQGDESLADRVIEAIMNGSPAVFTRLQRTSSRAELSFDRSANRWREKSESGVFVKSGIVPHVSLVLAAACSDSEIERELDGSSRIDVSTPWLGPVPALVRIRKARNRPGCFQIESSLARNEEVECAAGEDVLTAAAVRVARKTAIASLFQWLTSDSLAKRRKA